ncbi:MAG: hypothetical protein ACR2FJ_09245 [Qipengyuania sp.]
MSVQLDISEARLRLGVFKMALSLVGLFALIAFVLTLVAGQGQSIAVNALFVSVAFGFLTNGVFAILKIIDWFEARRSKNG